MQIWNITFLNPNFFWLILIIPIILYFFYKKQKKGINFINFSDAKKIFWKNNLRFFWSILVLSLILFDFIVILANPNTTNVSEKIKKNWIDIVIALDISGSMESEDLKPNRLEAAKKVINSFIKKLKTDRVWMVVFAWKPFTSIPLTFDYNILTETINRLSTKDIQSNWTAIWDAILMWETLFDKDKKEKNREKVMILLTDWDANVWVDPKVAALSAKEKNIKIYTIWIWSKKWWYISYNVGPFVQKQRIPPLNDRDLKYIAQNTSWKYFRADSNETFKKIFKELQKLEKNEIETEIKKTYKEYYSNFVYILIILLLIFSYLIFGNLDIKNKN